MRDLEAQAVAVKRVRAQLVAMAAAGMTPRERNATVHAQIFGGRAEEFRSRRELHDHIISLFPA